MSLEAIKLVNKDSIDDFRDISNIFEEYNIHKSVIELSSDFGIMYKDSDGNVLGSTFLYFTNSPTIWFDLFVVKKGLQKSLRNTVINTLLEAVIQISLSKGYRYIMVQPSFQKSIKRLEGLGFVKFGNKGFYTLKLGE